MSTDANCRRIPCQKAQTTLSDVRPAGHGCWTKNIRVIVIDEITAHDWPINNQCHRDQQQQRQTGLHNARASPGFQSVLFVFSRNHLADHQTNKFQFLPGANQSAIKTQPRKRRMVSCRVVCCMMKAKPHGSGCHDGRKIDSFRNNVAKFRAFI